MKKERWKFVTVLVLTVLLLLAIAGFYSWWFSTNKPASLAKRKVSVCAKAN
jgi:flagellar basal body-associated protein FliL